MKYADVIIDNKSEETDTFFTYGCLQAVPAVGQRVYVPFGKGDKIREAYVFRVFEGEEGQVRGLKYIDALDPDIILTQEILDTALFVKRRVLCKTIDALRPFLPVGKAAKRKREKPYKSTAASGRQAVAPTEEQARVLADIAPYTERREHNIFLLHGVTGSGKTEVYMRAIETCLRQGRTAVMAVPEISLTKQVTEQFFARFGTENTAVIHSKITPGQRYDEWMRIRRGEARIVIGARSALFAPLENIGIIVMDEEHESSYKSDQTPKYDALDIAVKRAKHFDAVLLLGSATPSVVSTYRAQEGIYMKLTMPSRCNNAALPTVETVDMRKELLSGNRSIISNALYAEMNECLRQKRQIILFLNRRGYAPFISCRECGYTMKCPQCGISLTYHKSIERVTCHYCGHREELPRQCPECGSRFIRHFGTGTEMLQEITEELFPEAAVARLDLDTVSRKGSIEAILGDFKSGRTDILIGTQLVAKGLDFKNVRLVGIVAADISLNIPDFRSSERTFQLITQAAGRAGRGDEQGKVIIQSYTPEHYAVKTAAAQDYDAFYRTEIRIRESLAYPPFGDLMQAVVAAADEDVAAECAEAFHRMMCEAAGPEKSNFLPPRRAPIAKANGKYRYQIVVKCPQGKRAAYTAALAEAKQRIFPEFKKKKALLSFDINPYSFI